VYDQGIKMWIAVQQGVRAKNQGEISIISSNLFIFIF
jgi:hypothetical protein